MDISFLTYIKDEFEYMARDENRNLYAHDIKPKNIKNMVFWIGGDSANIFRFDVDFPMIKYSDEQPWKISDIKN